MREDSVLLAAREGHQVHSLSNIARSDCEDVEGLGLGDGRIIKGLVLVIEEEGGRRSTISKSGSRATA